MNPYHFAIKTLLENNINHLPVQASDIEAILKLKGWKIISYDLNDPENFKRLKEFDVLEYAKEYNAFSYQLKDLKIVFCKIGLSSNVRAFALAHELGHICCGHFSDTGILGKHTDNTYDEPQEIEANAFARSFLAPVCILQKMHVKTIGDVERCTMLDTPNAEIQAGACKMHTIQAEQERKLIGNFKNYIAHSTEKSKIKVVTLTALIVVVCTLSVLIGYIVLNQKNDVYVYPTNSAAPTTAPIKGDKVLIRGTEYNLDMPVCHVKSNTEVFHKPDCSYIAGKENLAQQTIGDALKSNLRPCSRCFK